MSEFESQSGDGEIAVCHVCAKEFPTQKALLAHLEEAHDGEIAGLTLRPSVSGACMTEWVWGRPARVSDLAH